MNDERAQLNLDDMAAFILGALLALLAVVLIYGCSTIRTLPGIGAALTPAWDEATLAGRKGHTA